VAAMLDLGIIDKSGRFANPGTLGERLPPAIASRISEKGGEASFELAGGQEQVVLTQADIRQVQLAKGAIRAGIRLLLQKVGLEDAEIERILLAGAFGNYIRRESALRMGLLPDVPAERIHFVGNAACSGAEMILVSSNCRQMARELARKIEYIEIAHEKEFGHVFAEAMGF
jgi:uncharacterized 2Fe-2S/4Fe-4S cluster protein (DUF4445 family)